MEINTIVDIIQSIAITLCALAIMNLTKHK